MQCSFKQRFWQRTPWKVKVNELMGIDTGYKKYGVFGHFFVFVLTKKMINKDKSLKHSFARKKIFCINRYTKISNVR